MPGVWAIVVAAGSSERFVNSGGDQRDHASELATSKLATAKQFADLGGTRVVDHSVATARATCDGVVLVLPAGVEWDGVPVDEVVPGGATRSSSVRAGLAAVPAECEVVLVHDGARPLASRDLFVRVADAVRAGADAAVPALPVTDTLKRVDDANADGARVVETIDRASLVSVQTPQAFRASVLRAAHAGESNCTDDAALVEARGGVVVCVAGEPTNLKITTPSDLVLATTLMHAR